MKPIDLPPPCHASYAHKAKLKLEHARKVHEFVVHCVLENGHHGKHEDLSGEWYD